MQKKIAIIWGNGNAVGNLKISQGRISGMRAICGGKITGELFSFAANHEGRLEFTAELPAIPAGSPGPIITVASKKNPFSFFVRDVNRGFPIHIPEFSVIVTEAADKRPFEEIARAISARGRLSKLMQLEHEPEENYENAAAHVRSMRCNTWLGLSRDMRIFEVIFPDPDRVTMQVAPKNHGMEIALPEIEEKVDSEFRKWHGAQPIYSISFGRGCGCAQNLKRHLEDGVLPILHAELTDEDIKYKLTMFVVPEKTKLAISNLRGTHFLVADGHGGGHMFTEEQKVVYEKLAPEELHRAEETVLFIKIEAINTSNIPRYAFFKTPILGAVYPLFQYDFSRGFASFSPNRIFAVCTLDGAPLSQEEFAPVIPAGKKAVVEYRIPHEPVSRKRAEKILEQDFETRHSECRKFWTEKLETAAKIHLPERRVEEMVKAGLLHLDLVAYGLEPDGPVAACIGTYCPIGSESSPIIQFMDSMGWHSLAERALQYFIVKQHEDGFIQNFGGYMLETGAALWSMGEHYRYTSDEKWVKRIKPNITRACEYMMDWRTKNKREQLRDKGYGMLDGKVADPEDFFHSFSLNGYAYLGFSRAAEMLERIASHQSARFREEAEDLKKDIRKAFFDSVARSPVVPLGDGTWVPTAPPWADDSGLLCQFADGRKWQTHGTFLARDSMLGPLYLVFQEVLDPYEQSADFLIRYHAELFHMRNVAFSQPYYSRHPWVHLARGEVRAFLKAYYNCFAALADRETYSFWEHFFHASPHKTHEEAWFLMETRWMLYREHGDELYLLSGIPRMWMEHGKEICIEGAATYFGKLTLIVKSQLEHNRIKAEIAVCPGRKLNAVAIRLPHPDGLKPVEVIGGVYDPKTESVLVRPFEKKAQVIIDF
jgi:hypothetical protein